MVAPSLLAACLRCSQAKQQTLDNESTPPRAAELRRVAVQAPLTPTMYLFARTNTFESGRRYAPREQLGEQELLLREIADPSNGTEISLHDCACIGAAED